MAAATATNGARRSAEERARARALGVDRYGRPTARALGISPRQLRKADPTLTVEQARRVSAARLEDSHRLLAGAGRSPDTRGVPATSGRVTEGEPPQGVDSDGRRGHVDLHDTG